MNVTPNLLAISTLISARRYVGFRCGSPDWHITTALWKILWDLQGEELQAGLLLVKIEHTRADISAESRHKCP